jgi:hypothetical protein
LKELSVGTGRSKLLHASVYVPFVDVTDAGKCRRRAAPEASRKTFV